VNPVHVYFSYWGFFLYIFFIPTSYFIYDSLDLKLGIRIIGFKIFTELNI